MSINDFDKAQINDTEWKRMLISNAANRPNAKTSYGPGKTAAQTKEIFDVPLNELKNKHNLLLKYAKEEEAARAAAEVERQTYENNRNTQEKLRRQAEGSTNPQSEYYGGRALAEQERATAEKKRDDAEKKRDDAENTRKETFTTNEQQREDTFTGNELARQNTFVANENVRKRDFNNAETERQRVFENAEAIRHGNENERVLSEIERNAKIFELEIMVGEISAAVDAILDLRDTFIGGEE